MLKLARLSLLSLVLLVACTAQGGAQAPAAPAPDTAGQNDTLARIRALIGTPSCDADSQCRSLAIGERPCGGPEGFLAYSTVKAPDAELHALGAIYRAERRKANVQAGRVSDCRAIPDPGAVCRAGACVLGASQPVAR